MKLLAIILFVQIVMGVLNEWAINYLQEAESFKLKMFRYLLHGGAGILLSYSMIYLYVGKEQFYYCSMGEYLVLSVGSTAIMELVTYLILNRRKKFLDLKQKSRMWKRIAYFWAFAIIAVWLELVLFNYQHIITRNNHRVESTITIGKGLEQIEENTYKVVDKEQAAITFEGFDAPVNSVLFNMNRFSLKACANVATTVKYEAIDAENAMYSYCGTRKIVGNVPRSHNAIINLSGHAKSIRLTLDAEKDDLLTINNMGLNTVIPFEFLWIRMAAIFAGLVVIYMVRPKSKIYGVRLKRSKLQKEV